MEEDVQYVRFDISSFDELRTLVAIWKDMIATIFAQTPTDSEEYIKLALNVTLRVTVQMEEKPGREVFLCFMAPRSLVEQFFTTLVDLGLNFTKEEVEKDESLMVCQLISPISKH